MVFILILKGNLNMNGQENLPTKQIESINLMLTFVLSMLMHLMH